MLELLKNIEFIKGKNLEIIQVEDKVFSLVNGDDKYVLNMFPYGKYGKIKKIHECLKILSTEFSGLIIYEDIGIIDERFCYRIIKFIEDKKNELDEKISYETGLEIGNFINRFHKYFQSADCGRWYKHYNYRINRLLHEYGLGSYRGEFDYILFDFLDENRYYLNDRTCTTIMGIYGLDDIVISKDGKFQILEEYKILRSDAYFEFRNMNLDYENSEALLTGIVNGYFNGKVPRAFFKLLGVYTIIENLYGIFSKSNELGSEYINEKIMKIITAYNGFSSIYPVWYLKK